FPPSHAPTRHLLMHPSSIPSHTIQHLTQLQHNPDQFSVVMINDFLGMSGVIAQKFYFPEKSCTFIFGFNTELLQQRRCILTISPLSESCVLSSKVSASFLSSRRFKIYSAFLTLVSPS